MVLELAELMAEQMVVELLAVGLAAQLLPKLEGNSMLNLALLCGKSPSKRSRNVDLIRARTRCILGMSAHRAIAVVAMPLDGGVLNA